MMTKNKKIAIITHYCDSINYGGNLQAFALPYFLNKLGYEAEQISYPTSANTQKKKSFIEKIYKKSLIRILTEVYAVIESRILNFLHKKDLKHINTIKSAKLSAFKNFQLNMIPHTKKRYMDYELSELNKEFDVFITGSDQVFNFNFAKDGYFLNFVNEDKIKFSYAASMALDEIPSEKHEFMKKTLEKYNAISVREEKTVEILQQLTNRDIELSVDPTLLLEKEDWDKVSSPALLDDKYLLCYFLGDNRLERKIAKEFAKEKGLKIICIPTCFKRYKMIDESFGDINLLDASPEDFISLIKNAEFVFTDSFHACVFSIIYNKQFVVFNRDSKMSMSNRIDSLMNLYNIKYRFVNDERISLNHINSILCTDTNYKSKKAEELITSSKNFLTKNITNYLDF